MAKEVGTCKSTVTLTNWKRLSNAPINLGWVSVVHWRDFIVATSTATIKPSFDSYPDHPLPSGSPTPITRQSADVEMTKCTRIPNADVDKIELGPTSVLLYNPKWNMWSTLPSIDNEIKPAQGCPLVVYGDKLLFLSCQGRFYEFICETGGWEVNKSIDPYIIKGEKRYTNFLTVALTACHGDTMFLIYAIKTIKYSNYGSRTSETIENFVNTFNGTSKSWSNPAKLQTNVLNSGSLSHFSISVKDSKTVYVSTGHDIYSLLFEPAPDTEPSATKADTSTGLESKHEKIPVPQHVDSSKPVVTTVQVAHPPQKIYTLCVINGCLFVFGGKDSDNQPFSSIYKYDTEADVWNPAGNMCTSRYGVAAVVFNREEENLLDIFVVGGYLGECYHSRNLVKLACRVVDHCEVSIKLNKE